MRKLVGRVLYLGRMFELGDSASGSGPSRRPSTAGVPGQDRAAAVAADTAAGSRVDAAVAPGPSGVFTDLVAAASTVVARAESVLSPEGVRDSLRQLQHVRNLVELAEVKLYADLEATAGFGADGASSAPMWAQTELGVSAREAKRWSHANRAADQLPEAAQAAGAGRIRVEHLAELSAAITRTRDPDLIKDCSPALVSIAEHGTIRDLRDAVKLIDQAVNSDRLDDAYADGMDKQDFQIVRCGNGWEVTGWLDTVLGAKFRTWLDSASAPRRRRPADTSTDTGADPASADDPASPADPDDTRTPAERRIDALTRLIDHAGTDPDTACGPDCGLPAQLNVTLDIGDVIDGHLTIPANLFGYGPIGNDLLDYLTCGSQITEILTDGHTRGDIPQARVLNVGRTRRLATPQQRIAVRHRQAGICANPGCASIHIELHHVAWWRRDNGPTNLDNLIGLCTRCHHLVHSGNLTITRDGHNGWTFHTRTGRIRPDHRRRTHHAVTQALRTAVRTLTINPGSVLPPDTS